MRKSKLLRGTNILVTEDFPKRVREHRNELVKFAKQVFIGNPLETERKIDNQEFK